MAKARQEVVREDLQTERELSAMKCRIFRRCREKQDELVLKKGTTMWLNVDNKYRLRCKERVSNKPKLLSSIYN